MATPTKALAWRCAVWRPWRLINHQSFPIVRAGEGGAAARPALARGTGKMRDRQALALMRGPIKKPDRALQKLVRVYPPWTLHLVQ